MIALFAWLFLGEQITWRVTFGGVLIMLGLITVTWAIENQRKKAARESNNNNTVITTNEIVLEELEEGVGAQKDDLLSREETLNNGSTAHDEPDGTSELRKVVPDLKETEKAAYGTFV